LLVESDYACYEGPPLSRSNAKRDEQIVGRGHGFRERTAEATFSPSIHTALHKGLLLSVGRSKR